MNLITKTTILKSQKGSSIIEVIVAASLFAVVIVMVMQLFTNTIMSSSKSLHSAKALIIAESYIESSDATYSAWNTIYSKVSSGSSYVITLKDLPHLKSIGKTKYEVEITYNMKDSDMSKEHISKDVKVSWIGLDKKTKNVELSYILTRD